MPSRPSALAFLALAALLPALAARADAQGDNKKWATVKGRIEWGGTKLPEVKWIVPSNDKALCLTHPRAKDGKVPDESLIVNPKNKGVKNVFIYLYLEPKDRPNLPIHPDLAKFNDTVVIDQPCCSFEPRALVLREGQKLLVKNSAPVAHNFQLLVDPKINGSGVSVQIKNDNSHTVTGLKPQKLPMVFQCSQHNSMSGRLLVVDHPYYAVTDDDGNFEIKLVPVGERRFMIYHEQFGYRLGAKGRDGEAHMVRPGVTDLGNLPLGTDPGKDDD